MLLDTSNAQPPRHSKGTHAVIPWINENTFSMVDICDILLDKTQNVEIAETYLVAFGYRKFHGCVKFIGKYNI